MNGVSSRQATANIELQGHLIDSLTLSKVIDMVLEMGGDYRINDIEIGTQKKDISYVSLTVGAKDAAELESLLETLKPYGIKMAAQQETRLETVQDPAALAEKVYRLKCPKRIHIQGEWVDVEGNAPWVIRVDATARKAEVIELKDLKPGDQVLAGAYGVEW